MLAYLFICLGTTTAMIMPRDAGTNGRIITGVKILFVNVVAEVDKVIEIYEEEAKKWKWIKLKERKNRNDDAAKKAAANEAAFLEKIARLQNKHYRLNVIFLAAAGSNSLAISGNEWDQNPYLIACPNGVIDLKDNEFRDGRQEDYIKTVCPTEWLGDDATAPTMGKIFDGDI